MEDKQEYFEGFKTDMYIPSIKDGEITYTWVGKEGLNEAIFKGYMSSPSAD